MDPAWAHLVDVTQYFPQRLVSIGTQLLDAYDPPLQSLLFVDVLQKDASNAPAHALVNCLSSLPALSKLLAFVFRRDGVFVVLNARRKELFSHITARTPFQADFGVRVDAFQAPSKAATDDDRANAAAANAAIARELFAYATSDPKAPVGFFDNVSETLTNPALIEGCASEPFRAILTALAELRSTAADLTVVDVSTNASTLTAPFCDAHATHRARLAGRVVGAYATAGVNIVANAIAGSRVTVVEQAPAAAVAAADDGDAVMAVKAEPGTADGADGAATADPSARPTDGTTVHEVRADGLDLTLAAVLTSLERQHEKPSSRAKDALVGAGVLVDGMATAEELPVLAAGVAAGPAALSGDAPTLTIVPAGDEEEAISAAAARYAFAPAPTGDGTVRADGSIVVSVAALCNTLPSAATRTLLVQPSPHAAAAYEGVCAAHDAAMAAAGADNATIASVRAAASAALQGPCGTASGGLGVHVVVAPLTLGYASGADGKAAVRDAVAAAAATPAATAITANVPLYIATIGVSRATAKTIREIRTKRAKAEPAAAAADGEAAQAAVKAEGADGEAAGNDAALDTTDAPAGGEEEEEVEYEDVDAALPGYTVYVLGDTISVRAAAPPEGYESTPKDAKEDAKGDDDDDESMSRDERRAAVAARRATERHDAARRQWAAVVRAADGAVEVLTGPLTKALADVSLEGAEESSDDSESDNDDRKARRKARFEALPTEFDRSKLRGAHRVMKDVYAVNDAQRELWLALRAEVKANGYVIADPTQQKRDVTCLARFANDKLQPYKRSPVELRAALSRVPTDRQKGHVFFDEAHLTLFVPICAARGGDGPPGPVPFYAATLKAPAPWKDTEGGSSAEGMRVLFQYTPKTPSVAKYADCCFVKELVVVGQRRNATDFSKVKASVDTALKRIKQRDVTDTNEATTKKQPPIKLHPRGTQLTRLPGVQMRPPPVPTRGKKNAGAVELHANGLRYSVSGIADSACDIIFDNIKHALLVTATSSDMMTLIHFRLHTAILVAKKPTTDIQFAFEFEDEERGGYMQTEEQEERQEAKQRAIRIKMNREFHQFASRMERFLNINFEPPEKHEQLMCSVAVERRSHGHVPLRLFSRCIGAIEETPYIVITAADVEVAIFEGVDFGRKQTCDCVLVYKGYKTTATLGNLSQTAYRLFQMWFCNKGIPFLELSKEGLAWPRLLPVVLQQAKDGDWNPWSSRIGWPSMLDGRPAYVPPDSDESESGSGSDDGSSSADSESDDSEFTASSLSSESESSWSGTSSEDAAPSEDSDDSGDDWSDHERRAVKSDRKRGDDEDDEPRRKAPARSASTAALSRAAASRGQQRLTASGQILRSGAAPTRPVRAGPAHAAPTAARTTGAHRPDAMRARTATAAASAGTGAVRAPAAPGARPGVPGGVRPLVPNAARVPLRRPSPPMLCSTVTPLCNSYPAMHPPYPMCSHPRPPNAPTPRVVCSLRPMPTHASHHRPSRPEASPRLSSRKPLCTKCCGRPPHKHKLFASGCLFVQTTNGAQILNVCAVREPLHIASYRCS